MPCEVNKCCFCVELKTGCLIIGYLNLVWNVFCIGALIAAMVTAVDVAATAKDQDTIHAAELTLALLAIALIFVIINLMFTILLLVGIRKHNGGYIKAYLIYTCIFIIFGIINAIGTIGRGSPATQIVQNLVSLMVSIYYFVVVRSYYLKMDYTVPMMA